MRTLATLPLIALILATPVQAAITAYTDQPSFAGAAGPTTADDFEAATFDGTTIGFSAGSITCSGGNFCNSFFGLTFGGGLARSGTDAPYFGTPDTLTFSFAAPLKAFGIYIGGSGDVGVQNLLFTFNDGSSFTPFPNYTNGSGSFLNNTLFAGFVSTTSFTSLTITGANIADGVFFDDASFATARGVVPEPASWAMMLAGFGLVGTAARSRQRRLHAA